MEEIDHLAAAAGMPIPADHRDGVLRHYAEPLLRRVGQVLESRLRRP